MSPYKRKRAFTVLEALVAMSILSLLLTSMYMLLIYGLRSRRQAEVYQAVHQQVEIGLQKVRRELGDSNISTLSFGTTPPHVIFLSLELGLDQPDRAIYTYTAAGLPEWKKWVCFYLDSSSNILYRSESVLAMPILSSPPPVVPDIVDFQDPALRRPVARNVQDFVVDPGAGLQTLFVSLTASAMVNSDRATTITLNTDLRIRN